jgi:glycosyltransferase involved in cell wall biosynthesis
MRVIFVLGHESIELHGEIREATLALQLTLLGHDVRLFRLWNGNQLITKYFFEGLVRVDFYPTDNPSDDVHDHVSTGMLAAIRALNPEALLFKGLDYQVVSSVIESCGAASCSIGLIVGGQHISPVIKYASYLLVESVEQSDAVNTYLSRFLPYHVLAKRIDWRSVNEAKAWQEQAGAKEFDIVNVGYFDSRKNQIKLSRYFGKYRIAFVGHGPLLDDVRSAASSFRDVIFFGPVENEVALRVVSNSRIMVHTSIQEGVPRVFAEALACGVPVLAYRHAIASKFDNCDAIRLVDSDEELDHVAKEILGGDLISQLSRSAEAFALANYGTKRLNEGALFIHNAISNRTA